MRRNSPRRLIREMTSTDDVVMNSPKQPKTPKSISKKTPISSPMIIDSPRKSERIKTTPTKNNKTPSTKTPNKALELIKEISKANSSPSKTQTKQTNINSPQKSITKSKQKKTAFQSLKEFTEPSPSTLNDEQQQKPKRGGIGLLRDYVDTINTVEREQDKNFIPPTPKATPMRSSSSPAPSTNKNVIQYTVNRNKQKSTPGKKQKSPRSLIREITADEPEIPEHLIAPLTPPISASVQTTPTSISKKQSKEKEIFVENELPITPIRDEERHEQEQQTPTPMHDLPAGVSPSPSSNLISPFTKIFIARQKDKRNQEEEEEEEEEEEQQEGKRRFQSELSKLKDIRAQVDSEIRLPWTAGSGELTSPSKQQSFEEMDEEGGDEKDSRGLPSSVTISQFKRHAKMSVSTDAYPVIERAGKIFLDNLTRDLEAFAEHAHRRTIEQEDVELELKRQRFLTPKSSLADLMRTNLPWELVEQVIPIARANNVVSIKLQSRSKSGYTTNLGKRKRDPSQVTVSKQSRRPDWSESSNNSHAGNNYGRPNKKKKLSLTQIEGIVDEEDIGDNEDNEDFQQEREESEESEGDQSDKQSQSSGQFSELSDNEPPQKQKSPSPSRVRFKSMPFKVVVEEEEEEEEEDDLEGQRPKRIPNIAALSKELNSEE